MSDPTYIYRVGVDPAWKNLGVALVKEDVETHEITLVKSWVMNPSTFKSIPDFVDALWKEVIEAFGKDGGEILASANIERFVAYAGVSTAETENICMIIGALQYLFKGREMGLHRAIDWKMDMVKALHKKKEFENPSSKLDKKFSIAAAKACLDHEHTFATDHEADAVCLASYPVITRK
jgi:hypothetical protein